MEHRRIGQLAQLLERRLPGLSRISLFDLYESEIQLEVPLDLAASSKIEAGPRIQTELHHRVDIHPRCVLRRDARDDCSSIFPQSSSHPFNRSISG